MRKRAVLLMMIGIVALCVGCSRDDQDAVKTATQESVEIIIWTNLDENTELPVVEEVCSKWAAATGNMVRVVLDTSEDPFISFMQAAGTPDGPDIQFGMSNDLLGLFNTAGLLSEVPSSVFNTDEYLPVAVDAVTLDGKFYALPWSIETIALYYNTDMVSESPETWDELIRDAQDVGFMIDTSRVYFSYPILSGSGGYIYKFENGSFDTEDIGLGEASRKGYEIINSLYNEYNLMPTDTDFNMAKTNFQNGKIGLYVGGMWDSFSFDQNEIPYEIANLPTIDGNPMRPFVGAKTGVVSSRSTVQKEAWELMKYLTDNAAIPLYEVGKRIPVRKSIQETDSVQSDPIISAFISQASFGDAMPNIPEMNAIWYPCLNNIQALINNQVTVDDIVKNIPAQIRENIANMNSGN